MPATKNLPGESDINNQLLSLDKELGRLQRLAIQAKIPVAIVFEGADGAGKGKLINHLLLSLDPRGFKVYATHSATSEAIFRPHLWRFWLKTPERDLMTIYDRSWYRHLLDDRVDGLVPDEKVPEIVQEITDFERQLTDDGVVLIKIYLTISEKKQHKRFKKLAENSSTSWRVSKKDWKRHKRYDDYREMVEDMVKLTETDNAGWNLIDSKKMKLASLEIMKLVRDRLTSALENKKLEQTSKTTPDLNWRSNSTKESCLDTVDLSLAIKNKDYLKKLKTLSKRLYDLGHELHLSRRPVVLAFEGWDAAGKGGAIRRLSMSLDPRSYEVIPVAAPNELEKSHHYLWRFWRDFPKGGHIGIYDRSWYGRVTVERLEGFCTEADWKRAYDEINEMERHWSNHGTIILKFWIHVDKDEQLRRFKARQENPDKQWKITEEDWRNREKWDEYKIAVEDMIDLTNKPNAPWIIVEGNDKQYARIKVLESTVKALESVL